MNTPLRYMRSLLMILTTGLLSLSLASCLGDDDEPNYPAGAEELVGYYTGKMTLHLPDRDSLVTTELELGSQLIYYPIPMASVLDSVITMPMTTEQRTELQTKLASVALYANYAVASVDNNTTHVEFPATVTDIRIETKEGYRTVRISLSADEPLVYHRDSKSIDMHFRFHDASVNGEVAESFHDITLEGTLRCAKASN